MRRLIAAALAVWMLGHFTSPADAAETTLFECVAQKRLAGREEPRPDAPQTRLPDGTPRYLEKGDTGYTGVERDQPLPEWLELFGTPGGHGSSFLGFYLSTDFKCTKIDS